MGVMQRNDGSDHYVNVSHFCDREAGIVLSLQMFVSLLSFISPLILFVSCAEQRRGAGLGFLCILGAFRTSLQPVFLWQVNQTCSLLVSEFSCPELA